MFLEINNLSKKYGDKTILSKVSLSLAAHATLSILGKSGCGKSTLLKLIAGMEPQDEGEVILKGRTISDLPAQQREVVYLFQEPMLFPHLNVFENVAFGLRIRKEKKAEINTRVTEILERLEMTSHTTKMPHQLSGGQKQRIAFGRALIINPPLILLDEPFSSLDVEIRASMQELYKKIAKQFDITALFVTHDLKEALLMGDQIAYMEHGNLQIFESKAAFTNDVRTGVQNEMAFWRTLEKE